MGTMRTLNGSARRMTKDVGATGLQETYGRIQDDFLKEWRGLEKVKRVDQMLRNSPVIGALRLAMEMPIRDIDWQFTSEEGAEDPRLELLNGSFHQMSHSWNDHMSEALLFPYYGWSMFTLTYQKIDGRYYWRKFKQLGNETVQHWLFADDGGLLGLQQYAHLWPKPIPIERMIVYRMRHARGNPEGESILRPAWIPFYYASNLQEIEAIGIERNLAGLPVLEMPRGADPNESGDDFKTADKIVRNIRNDEQGGIVLPPPMGETDNDRWRLTLMSSAGLSKAIDTNIVISRYEKRILMSSLAQFLMLGMDSVGALATFEGGNDFFNASVNSVADIIAETVTKFAIPRLMKLNGLPADGLKLEHSPAGDIDLEIMSKFLQATGSLVTWTADDEVWLRSLARLPEKTPDEVEEAREEAEQRRATIAAQFRPQNNQNSDDNEDGDMTSDENAAVFFAADAAPDDDDRRKFERSWERKWRQWFKAQNGRVVEGVKNA